MSVRDKKTGRFIPNVNTWEEKNGLLYCFLNDELLFFTEAENKLIFDGLSVSKLALGYSAVRIADKEVAVHRVLTGAKAGDIVDHINRDRKDNRLTNLRITDKSGNAFNTRIRTDNTSGVKGVSFRKDTKRWQAEIKVNYKKISLGCYATKEEAAEARRKAEVKYCAY